MRALVLIACTSWCAVVPTVAVAAGPGPAPAAARPLVPADPDSRPHDPSSIIVGFRPGATPADRSTVAAAAGASRTERLSVADDSTFVLRLPPGRSIAAALDALRRNPTLRFAEPDYVQTVDVASNDPYSVSGSLWGMYGDTSAPSNQYGSQAAEAWAGGAVGSSETYVVVIDEGIDISHPDLAANIWTNPYETANGVDDDGNGFVDDLHGWDFLGNDATVFDGTADDHGTHVAGTIGAVGGNGIGVAGVNWDVTLISAKFLGASGGLTSNAVRAIDYAVGLKVRHGLNIVAASNSWGGGGFSQSLLDAINRAGDAGIVFVAAAGNSAVNTDGTAYYPAGYRCTTTASGAPRGWDCVVAVASITDAGARSDFSNYGASTVDLGAPGSSIVSTLPGNSYGAYSGTSMATPHVSGALALCASVNPTLGARELRTALLDTVAPTPSMSGITVTGGRLDAGALVARCSTPAAPLVGGPSDLSAVAVSSDTLRLSWTDGSSNEAFTEVQLASDGCTGFAAVATIGADATTADISGLTPSTTYCVRVRAGNSYLVGGVLDVSAWSNTATATTDAPPDAYRCSATSFAWVDPTGGTPLTLADDSSTQVAIGFPFPFYGTTYSNVFVGSNGLIGFGTAAGDYSNTSLPNTGVPNGIAAVLWDDLSPNLGGSVSHRLVGSAPNRRFVVTWAGVPQYNVAHSAVTFQAVLDEATGSIIYQYLDVIFGDLNYDRGAGATVGLETPDGLFGTTVSYNRASILDRSALRCLQAATSSPSVTTTALPDGHLQSPYEAGLVVVGGTAPYTWALSSGSLPAGLVLTTASGLVSGTPTATGSSTFVVRVTDAEGRSATSSVSLQVDQGVTVTSSSLSPAGVGVPYSTTLAASGGTGPYTWSATGVPGGMSLSAAGVLSGTPVAAGSSTVIVSASDSSSPALVGTRQLVLTVSSAPDITTTTLTPGTVGVSLARTLTVSAGAAPYTWTVSSGSPPAGVSLSGAGVLSGTPTTAGTSTFTARVSDAVGRVDEQVLSMTVHLPLEITTVSLPTAGVGLSYRATLTATGGSGGYGWSPVSLPPGLALSTSGLLSGSPTTLGTPTVQVVVTDTSGRTASVSLPLAVTAAPSITTTVLSPAGASIPYSFTLAASGGTETRTWSVVSGALPTGASLSSSGVLSGTMPTPGTSSFTVRVTDSFGRSAERSLGLQVLAPVVVGTASLPQGTAGVGYSALLAAAGGTGSFRWSATGLPPGLTVDASTGVVAGSPSATGSYTAVVTASDGGMPAASGSRSLTLVVAAPLSITTVSLPTAYRSSTYSTTLAASGGSGTLTWSLSSGSLPSGLALSSSGVLSGTPSVSGTFTPTFRVADAFGRSATKALTVSVFVSTTVRVSTIGIVKSITSTGVVGTATVTVVNGFGAPVGSVTVTGSFTVSGITGSSSKSSTTSTAGVAIVRSNAYKSITGRTLTFCVTSLARTGFTFDRTGPSCVSTVV